eukprot:6953129-Karenia_brevis.AAC.1
MKGCSEKRDIHADKSVNHWCVGTISSRPHPHHPICDRYQRILRSLDFAGEDGTRHMPETTPMPDSVALLIRRGVGP